MKYRNRSITLAAILLLIGALACAGTVQNLRVDGLPQYTCPSSTPRATHTQPATSPPLWLPFFSANLSGTQVNPTFNVVLAQWTGQSAGTVYVAYSGSMMTYPYYWSGSGGFFAVDTIPNVTRSGAYGITIPTTVTNATIQIYASGIPNSLRSFTVVRVYSTAWPTLTPPPGGAPGSITATPRPTYTPWPTPTQYVRTNDYFLGDAIYTPHQPSGLQLRFRVSNIQAQNAAEPDRYGQPQSVYVWTFEVKNVGSVEYDLFPAGQMYVSTIAPAGGSEVEGVWGASLAAAAEAGLTPNYEMTDLQPDEAKTFTLAAYGPRGTARRIAYVLDVTARGGTMPTIVPGQNAVSWINEINTICTGEVEEP